MSSELAVQSNWERAKAAFHSIDWTSHMLPPTPYSKPLDIFCHPFNATMSEAATPLWESTTIYTSLPLRQMVYNTPSEESTMPFYSSKPEAWSTSDLSSSPSSPSSSSSDLFSEDQDEIDGVPGSPVSYLSADWPSFSPPSPEQVRALLLAETDASLPAWDEEIEQFKKDLRDNDLYSPSGCNKALPIGSPNVQDTEAEVAYDNFESMEVAQGLQLRIQSGEDYKIQYSSDPYPYVDTAPLPPRTPSPFEHIESDCAIASSIEDAECDALTGFENLGVFEKTAHVLEGHAELEKYYPEHLRSSTLWILDEELDSPAKSLLELALF